MVARDVVMMVVGSGGCVHEDVGLDGGCGDGAEHMHSTETGGFGGDFV